MSAGKTPLHTEKIVLKSGGTDNLIELDDGTAVVDAEGDVVGDIDAALPDGQIFVGKSSGVAGEVAMSGDATLANTGALTIANNAVTGQKASTNLKTKVSVTNIGGFNATEQKFIFICPQASTDINQILLVSDTATSGSDGSNNFTFQVQNLTQANSLLSAATTTDSNEIVADTAYSITPNQNNTGLAQGDVIELQITKTGTPTDLPSAEVMIEVISSNNA